jgi:outer membrane biosynthesis protein TonB
MKKAANEIKQIAKEYLETSGREGCFVTADGTVFNLEAIDHAKNWARSNGLPQPELFGEDSVNTRRSSLVGNMKVLKNQGAVSEVETKNESESEVKQEVKTDAKEAEEKPKSEPEAKAEAKAAVEKDKKDAEAKAATAKAEKPKTTKKSTSKTKAPAAKPADGTGRRIVNEQ